mmetsp:Transcript_29571/g.91428  ORF Transcript_29571/g.91428 Transcript_29571/m.91428 type:complete len:243 (-) Transcript_29571:2449-3177(-)
MVHRGRLLRALLVEARDVRAERREAVGVRERVDERLVAFDRGVVGRVLGVRQVVEERDRRPVVIDVATYVREDDASGPTRREGNGALVRPSRQVRDSEHQERLQEHPTRGGAQKEPASRRHRGERRPAPRGRRGDVGVLVRDEIHDGRHAAQPRELAVQLGRGRAEAALLDRVVEVDFGLDEFRRRVRVPEAGAAPVSTSSRAGAATTRVSHVAAAGRRRDSVVRGTRPRGERASPEAGGSA